MALSMGLLGASVPGEVYFGWIQNLAGGVSYPGGQIAYDSTSNTWYPGIMDDNGFGTARAAGFSKVDGETGQSVSGGISMVVAGSISRTHATAFDNFGNLLVGSSEGGNQGNCQIYKIDGSGNKVWQLRGSSNNSSVQSIAVDSANNYYFTGHHSYNSNSSFLLKTDSSGSVLWHKQLSNVFAMGSRVDVDSSDNVYVCLNVYSSPSRLVVQKWSPAGVIQWTKRVTQYSGDLADLCVTDNDEIVVAYSDNNRQQSVLSLSTSGAVNYQMHKLPYEMFNARMAKAPDGGVHVVWSNHASDYRHEIVRIEAMRSSIMINRIAAVNTFLTGIGTDGNNQVFVATRTSGEDWNCLSITNTPKISELYGTYYAPLATWIISASGFNDWSDINTTNDTTEFTTNSTYTWSNNGSAFAAYQPTYSLLAIP
jgi:hypothetical protein